MNGININRNASTIELTKKFDKLASRYGSEEYNMLQAARRDYPTFRVTVKAAPKSNDALKGLTFDYMRDYIAKHDGDDSPVMGEFLALIGDTDEARELGIGSESYGTVRAWFLTTYPVFKSFADKRKAILSVVNNSADKVAA